MGTGPYSSYANQWTNPNYVDTSGTKEQLQTRLSQIQNSAINAKAKYDEYDGFISKLVSTKNDLSNGISYLESAILLYTTYIKSDVTDPVKQDMMSDCLTLKDINTKLETVKSEAYSMRNKYKADLERYLAQCQTLNSKIKSMP